MAKEMTRIVSRLEKKAIRDKKLKVEAEAKRLKEEEDKRAAEELKAKEVKPVEVPKKPVEEEKKAQPKKASAERLAEKFGVRSQRMRMLSHSS